MDFKAVALPWLGKPVRCVVRGSAEGHDNWRGQLVPRAWSMVQADTFLIHSKIRKIRTMVVSRHF